HRPSLRIPNETKYIGGSVVPEEVTEEVVQQPEPDIRKSKRNRTPKNFGPEFQLYLIEGTRDEISDQHSNCFNVEGDSKTFDEAMNCRDIAFWKEAINDKMDSIMGNNTWVLADLPPGLYTKMDVKKSFLNDELDEEVDLTKEFLSSRFYMKDMGEADVILSIRIKHEISTPIDTSGKLMPNNGQAVSQLKYSRVIGCLMYAMTCTKPDIAFVVGKLVTITSNHGTQARNSAGTEISNIKDNSSISGWVFLLGGGAISWAFKKQTCITGSTMEFEFVALAAADKEAEWLKNLLLGIPLWSKPIAPNSIHCDSAATLAKFLRSQQNIVDNLTKGLAKDLVLKSAKRMDIGHPIPY
ncbi:hypothetical protein Tco_0918714, partial [Tanacetum coccineum]